MDHAYLHGTQHVAAGYHFGAYPGQDGDWWNPSESTFMIPPTSWEIE